MSAGYLVSLAIVVITILGSRFMSAALPVHRAAVSIPVADMALAGLGVAGLVFHCGAMFFRSPFEALPGTDAVISQIDALGSTSIIWYVVSAVLVLLGLRRLSPIMLAVPGLALSAVGITMYDGGSLPTHLTTIFVAVVILATVAAALVLPPSRTVPAAPCR